MSLRTILRGVLDEGFRPGHTTVPQEEVTARETATSVVDVYRKLGFASDTGRLGTVGENVRRLILYAPRIHEQDDFFERIREAAAALTPLERPGVPGEEVRSAIVATVIADLAIDRSDAMTTPQVGSAIISNLQTRLQSLHGREQERSLLRDLSTNNGARTFWREVMANIPGRSLKVFVNGALRR